MGERCLTRCKSDGAHWLVVPLTGVEQRPTLAVEDAHPAAGGAAGYAFAIWAVGHAQHKLVLLDLVVRLH